MGEREGKGRDRKTESDLPFAVSQCKFLLRARLDQDTVRNQILHLELPPEQHGQTPGVIPTAFRCVPEEEVGRKRGLILETSFSHM